jgi:hypothetical protein
MHLQLSNYIARTWLYVRGLLSVLGTRAPLSKCPVEIAALPAAEAAQSFLLVRQNAREPRRRVHNLGVAGSFMATPA